MSAKTIHHEPAVSADTPAMSIDPPAASGTPATPPTVMQIGIIAALPSELAPLVRGWKRAEGTAGPVHTGELTLPDGTRATAYAVCAGMGAAAAARAFGELTRAAQATGGLQAVISYGWAGALSCGVKPPDVYSVSEVIDSKTGERFPTATNAAMPLRLVTLDHFVNPDEKRPLAERYKAVLVDMEAATVARLAQAHGLAFYCCKGISDGYLDILPNFNRFIDSTGQLRLAAFVAHALLRPQYWRALAHLGAHSRTAARNLAAQLPACFRQAGLLS